jgi:hypothetical protein
VLIARSNGSARPSSSKVTVTGKLSLSEQTNPRHAAEGPFAVMACPVRDGVPYCLSADQLEMSRVLIKECDAHIRRVSRNRE